MCNPTMNAHGGFIAWLVDVCSSLPVLACSTQGRWATAGVSTSIHTQYLHAIPLGTKVKVVSSLMRVAKSTAWIEIRVLDRDSGRLLAFATHVKQDTPAPKL